MAMVSNRGDQGFPLGGGPNRRAQQYSLKEALQAVRDGQMDWRAVLEQLPPPMLGFLVAGLPDDLAAHFRGESGSDQPVIPLILPEGTIKSVFSCFLAIVEEAERRQAADAVRADAQGTPATPPQPAPREDRTVDHAMLASAESPRQSVGARPTPRPQQYTIKQAVQAVIDGQMDWREVLTQLPAETLAFLVGKLPAEIADRFRDPANPGQVVVPLALPDDQVKTAFASFAAAIEAAERGEPAQISLDEALRQVATGAMDPEHLFPQLSAELRADIDRWCQEAHDGPFDSLTTDVQRDVLAKVAESLARAKRGESGNMTLLEAMQHAVDGKLDAQEVYAQLPEQARELVDNLARSMFDDTFANLAVDQRGALFAAFVAAASKNDEVPG